MPIAQAEIQTERASRYLVQFCKHAAAMDGGGHLHRIHLHEPLTRREVQVAAEWSDTTGTVTFTPWGRATLTADVGILTVRVDAADDDGLAQIRDVITRDLERFSRRDPLTVTWQRLETASTVPIRHTGTPTPKPRRRFSRAHLQTILLALAVVGVIGLHVGLAGAVVAQSPWTGVATNVLVALIVLKIALVAVARHGIRRRRATKTPATQAHDGTTSGGR
ncbi:hypothetical protein GCM10023176_24540 [Micromonospora coerulea]|uniref:DUF2218 domain-containing protein n=1 Tax=Micromonospora coerulea TaxID=47856 RepID=A0ABP8SK49_9ACTN